MTRVVGIPIQGGVSIGPIRLISRVKKALGQVSELSPSEELVRFESAKNRAVKELKRLQAKVAAHLGDDEAAIFLFHSMLLEDEDYLETIYRYINDSATAEYAIERAGQKVSDFFESLNDSYMQAKAEDARDISNRLDDILADSVIPQYPEPVIVASEELYPSVPALFVKNNLLGLVSHYGSADSHAAILARAAKIPALTGIKVNSGWDGHMAIIDGDNGVLTIDPDEETLKNASAKAKALGGSIFSGEQKAGCNINFRAFDNDPVRLFATVDGYDEARLAYSGGANGIGLYRAPPLAGGNMFVPTEEDRFTEYSQTVSAMHGRPVVFQSLNIRDAARGSPLGMSRLKWGYGYLRDQFRAVLRAAAGGPALIALSDIGTAKDIPRCRKLLDRCKSELEAEGLEYDSIDLGAIIRSPSSVLTLDSISAHTDFIALDGSALLRSLANSTAEKNSPDFFIYVKMLQTAIFFAHSHTQRIMLFGNLQHYLQTIIPLFRMGIDELSVPVKYLSDIQRVCQV